MKISVHPWNLAVGRKWIVSRGRGKLRKRIVFNTKADAEAEASRLRDEVSQAGQAWLELSPAERQTLIMVYADAQRKGLDLAALVANGKPTRSAGPSLGAVIRELVDVKAKAGRRPDYVEALESTLNAFAQGRQEVRVGEVSLGDVEGYLDAKAPASRSTIRSRLSTMFLFAVRRGYALANPCARIEPQSYRKPPPAVFTPPELRKALQWLAKRRPRALPWFILSTLCGLRPEEAEKTSWAEINFREGWVKVEAQTSKIGERRVVYPLPVAMNILQRTKARRGELPLNRQARRRTIRCLRNHLGWDVWPKDVTRHSAASYWLASGESASTVAQALGHSERILARNYRALVTKEQAKEFWRVVQSSCRKL